MNVGKRMMEIGIETRGVQPVPVEQRQDTKFYKIFFIWFSANCNILSFSAGTLGPTIFGLGVRDSCLTIVLFNLIFCAMPSYATTWGPKTGMRQTVISRYSFGYYGVLLICLLNLIGMCGFSILNCILGGQTLASVSGRDLSWTIGIVIIGVISLLVSFCGHTVLHWYERTAWFPVLLTFVIILGLNGKDLGNTAFEPATAPAVLSFASTLAGYTITWTPLGSDYTIYYRPDVSGWRLFLWSYFGLTFSTVRTLLQCTGAAVIASVPSVPLWEEAYGNGNVGGLLEVMLRPVHGFGKFLTVLLSLSVIGNLALSFYSVSLNLQLMVPFFLRVPRYIFSVIGTAIVVALAIAGQHKFYDTLVNFLGLLGYWAGAYIAIIFLEHLYFRKGTFTLYNLAAWNSPRLLPTGIAALAAGLFSFGVAVPCMDQVWFVGPIAKKTGDIGFEMAFVVGGILYFVFRWIEIKWMGRL
ncbi:NCS cytosine-purine permease [Macrolepiota fuliginosa MF-IS2]|uniref:NCS cytosine-purine permease n=1 Tax=Macrolepiota fuliginosa MF-IS2 TaxID=1400762 RepID=A0A9P6C4N7_9AGAR|nr:NCS cytosine-purine permease [Macrolepiota fuliginosa MF-IS2]